MKTKYLLSIALLLAVTSVALSQTKPPAFTRFSVKQEKIKNIKVNLKSHKNANMFRTNLRNAAKDGVNFAGHYILTTWGCGTNCSDSAIIDARNGRVFFPDILAGIGIGYCELPDETEPLVYKANSSLLILSGFKAGDLNRENGRCGIYYFQWTGTTLKQIKYVPKKRTPTS